MAKKKRVRRRRSKGVVFGLFVAVIVLILILISLVISAFGFCEENKPEMFIVKDECGLILGNLVHQIRDEGECRIKCVNECDVRDMDFVRINFELKNSDCNSCECWCE